jgi:hypothetical protein
MLCFRFQSFCELPLERAISGLRSIRFGEPSMSRQKEKRFCGAFLLLLLLLLLNLSPPKCTVACLLRRTWLSRRCWLFMSSHAGPLSRNARRLGGCFQLNRNRKVGLYREHKYMDIFMMKSYHSLRVFLMHHNAARLLRSQSLSSDGCFFGGMNDARGNIVNLPSFVHQHLLANSTMSSPDHWGSVNDSCLTRSRGLSLIL